MNFANQNPYQTPYAAANRSAAAYAAESERAAFIRRTYLHLLGAVVAFVMLEAALLSLTPENVLQNILFLAGGWGWLIFLGGFMVVSWLARSWAHNSASPSQQYAGLALYVVAQAVLFVPLLYVATRFAGPDVIPAAGVITLILFGGMTGVVFLTKADFSWMGRWLAWGGILALGLICCSIFFPNGLSLGVIFSAGMVALASGYILYDTSNVLHHYRTDQHVAAALALFASVALLLWYVIQILMRFSSSR